jgi:hypothetical protein
MVVKNGILYNYIVKFEITNEIKNSNFNHFLSRKAVSSSLGNLIVYITLLKFTTTLYK